MFFGRADILRDGTVNSVNGEDNSVMLIKKTCFFAPKNKNKNKNKFPFLLLNRRRRKRRLLLLLLSYRRRIIGEIKAILPPYESKYVNCKNKNLPKIKIQLRFSLLNFLLLICPFTCSETESPSETEFPLLKRLSLIRSWISQLGFLTKIHAFFDSLNLKLKLLLQTQTLSSSTTKLSPFSSRIKNSPTHFLPKTKPNSFFDHRTPPPPPNPNSMVRKLLASEMSSSSSLNKPDYNNNNNRPPPRRVSDSNYTMLTSPLPLTAATEQNPPLSVCGFSGLPVFPSDGSGRSSAVSVQPMEQDSSSSSSSPTIWVDAIIRDLIHSSTSVSIPRLQSLSFSCNSTTTTKASSSSFSDSAARKGKFLLRCTTTTTTTTQLIPLGFSLFLPLRFSLSLCFFPQL